MGADIHAYIEYRSVGRDHWHHYAHPWLSRTYETFSLLAGVRGPHQPVFPLRGFPEDAGFEAKDDNQYFLSDTPGDRYVTVPKAWEWVDRGYSKFIRNHTGNPTWVTDPDNHSHSWLFTQEFEQVLQELSRHREGEKPPIDYTATLAAMKALEEYGGHQARLVFWFDN